MKSAKFFGIVGMLAGLCLTSQASLLPPGGLTPPDLPQLPGSDIVGKLVAPYAGADGVMGTVTSWVVANSPGNTLGGLSFYYQINNTGSLPVGGFSIADFGIIPGSLVDVATVAGAFDTSVTGGQIPSFANRSSGAGSIIRFFFSGIAPGTSSAVLIVNTAYTQFGFNTGGILNNLTADVAILAPVPEPSTIMAASLLLLPLGASTLRILRKR